MTDLSFVPGVALGLTLGIGGTWMALSGFRAKIDAELDDALNDAVATAEALATVRAERDRSSEAAGSLRSTLDEVRDLLSQPETIRKADLRRILGEGQ